MNSNQNPDTNKPLPLSSIDLTYTQAVRDGLDENGVDDYVEKLKRGEEAPPIEVVRMVFSGGIKYWATDGWHRIEAAKRFGSDAILAHIVDGTEEDALRAALQTNEGHGVRRSVGDKRRIGTLAIQRHPDKTDGFIAEITRLSRPFISGLRKEISVADAHTTRVSRNGKKYEASKKGSGKRPDKKPSISGATGPGTGPAPDPSSSPNRRVDWRQVLTGAQTCEALLIGAAELAQENAHKLRHKDRLARAIREVLLIAESEAAAEREIVQRAMSAEAGGKALRA